MQKLEIIASVQLAFRKENVRFRSGFHDRNKETHVWRFELAFAKLKRLSKQTLNNDHK